MSFQITFYLHLCTTALPKKEKEKEKIKAEASGNMSWLHAAVMQERLDVLVPSRSGTVPVCSTDR